MKRIKFLSGVLLVVALAFPVGLGTLSVFADTLAYEDASEISLRILTE